MRTTTSFPTVPGGQRCLHALKCIQRYPSVLPKRVICAVRDVYSTSSSCSIVSIVTFDELYRVFTLQLYWTIRIKIFRCGQDSIGDDRLSAAEQQLNST